MNRARLTATEVTAKTAPRTNDSIDYIALAETLRRVRSAKTQHADEANCAKVACGGVRLDDILGFLDSDRARSILGVVRATAVREYRLSRAAQARSGDPYAVGVSDRYLPQDGLMHRVVGFFNFYNGGFGDDVPAELVARATVSAFADAADDGGIIMAAAVQRVLGDAGTALFTKIRRSIGSAPQPHKRGPLKFLALMPMVADKIARSRERIDFRGRMPLVADLLASLNGARPLAGWRMASVQHLFESSSVVYEALVDCGLEKTETIVGGKHYSANPDAVARASAAGYDVVEEARPRPRVAGIDAEKEVHEMAATELRLLFHNVDPSKETKPRFLLLDDGGKLIQALHTPAFAKYAHLCVAVEQTDRGIQIIEKMQQDGVQIRCPIVNMARSNAKKVSESPMIGEANVFGAELALARVHKDLEINPKIATVVGTGDIGKATIAALLRRGYEVYITDKSPEAVASAVAMAAALGKADKVHPAAREEALKNAHAYFSCTGKTTITPTEYDLLPDHAILVNCASGNHELGLHDLPPNFFADRDRLAKRDADGRIHTTFDGKTVLVGDAVADEAILNRVIRTDKGKEALALRSGSVIDMAVDLPPEYRQLIVALLVASCLQAVSEHKPELCDIRGDMQKFLVRRGTEHLERIGRSLAVPSFEGLATWYDY